MRRRVALPMTVPTADGPVALEAWASPDDWRLVVFQPVTAEPTARVVAQVDGKRWLEWWAVGRETTDRAYQRDAGRMPSELARNMLSRVQALLSETVTQLALELATLALGRVEKERTALLDTTGHLNVARARREWPGRRRRRNRESKLVEGQIRRLGEAARLWERRAAALAEPVPAVRRAALRIADEFSGTAEQLLARAEVDSTRASV